VRWEIMGASCLVGCMPVGPTAAGGWHADFFFPSSGFLRFVNGEFVASVIFNFVLQRLLE
jgi:hypothetical protein